MVDDDEHHVREHDDRGRQGEPAVGPQDLLDPERLGDPAQNPAAAEALDGLKIVKSSVREQDCLRISVDNGEAALPQIMKVLDGKDIAISNISLSTASLDDVFLEKPGRSLRDTEAEGGDR